MSPWLRVSFSWLVKGEAVWLDVFSCVEQKRPPFISRVLGAGDMVHTGYENPLWFPLGFAYVRTAEQELFGPPYPPAVREWSIVWGGECQLPQLWNKKFRGFQEKKRGLKVGCGGLVREVCAGRTEWDMGLEVEGKPERTGVGCARKPRKLLVQGPGERGLELQKQDLSFSHTAVPTAKTLHAVSTYPWTWASGPAPWHWQLQSGVGRHLLKSLFPDLPCCPTTADSLLACRTAQLLGALLPHTGDRAPACTLILQQTGSFSQPAGPDAALLVWHGSFLHRGH